MLLPLANSGSANTVPWYGVGDPAQSAEGKGKMNYETTGAYARRAASKALYAGAGKPGSDIGHRYSTRASASGPRTGSTAGRTGVGLTRSGLVISKSTSISEESSVSRGPPR